MEFIDLKTQYQLLQANIQQRIGDVLQHGQYIMGPEVAELEARLADYLGVKHCAAVGNGTDALFIALMALGVGPDDEVITTPFTFIATVETILLLGAKPVFVDIDPKTYNLDTSLLEKAITKKTKAILPVNIYGQCADYDPIEAIANRWDVAVIEDAAQSLGATYKGRQSGSFGKISCTSFFPSKPLGCYGDGGACFTQDDQLAKTIRQIRNHGQETRYHHISLGVNSRLDTLQAAILIAKLEGFAEELKLRQKVARKYSSLFSSEVVVPYVEPYNECVFAQYTIQVENRDHVRAHLQKRGIPTAVHYPIPLHKQPILADFAVAKKKFPYAEEISRKVLSLPFHPYLRDEEVEHIVKAVHEAIA